jgi:hypothetical protein
VGHFTPLNEDAERHRMLSIAQAVESDGATCDSVSASACRYCSEEAMRLAT